MVENENESCKVVLIGESTVGKTSIITRFMEQTFEHNLPSTIGANYSSTILNIDGKKAKFTIWDTAGQEKYRALTKLFYKDASAAILVYDITKSKTFKEIQTYWSKQIIENSPKNIITVIAANKSDLYEDEQVDEGEARKFAKEIGAMYKRTSALNSEGIENLFIGIGQEFFKTPPKPQSSTKENNIVIGQNNNQKGNDNVKDKKKCC